RVKIPLKEIKSAVAKDGMLTVRAPGQKLDLELGPYAEKWATKILNPKSVIDKLGIKPGQRVSLIGLDDEGFLQHLNDRGIETFTGSRAKKDSDAIFLLATGAASLDRLASLKSSIKRAGAIWVVAPKGKQRIREADILQEGRAAGLVDVKVVAFSAVYTAHKFVIPAADR
ncbi:MAG TPA: DUF3052 family protein, partial [Blastocatellia bacterium]|nr:DUF3052 family protein [Blastocatellia bacterium]